jgi:hypothetical protein
VLIRSFSFAIFIRRITSAAGSTGSMLVIGYFLCCERSYTMNPFFVKAGVGYGNDNVMIHFDFTFVIIVMKFIKSPFTLTGLYTSCDVYFTPFYSGVIIWGFI